MYKKLIKPGQEIVHGVQVGEDEQKQSEKLMSIYKESKGYDFFGIKS